MSFFPEKKEKTQRRSLADSAEVYACFGNQPYYMRKQNTEVKSRDVQQYIDPDEAFEEDQKIQRINAAVTDKRWHHFMETKTLRMSGKIPEEDHHCEECHNADEHKNIPQKPPLKNVKAEKQTPENSKPKKEKQNLHVTFDEKSKNPNPKKGATQGKKIGKH